MYQNVWSFDNTYWRTTGFRSLVLRVGLQKNQITAEMCRLFSRCFVRKNIVIVNLLLSVCPRAKRVLVHYLWIGWKKCVERNVIFSTKNSKISCSSITFPRTWGEQKEIRTRWLAKPTWIRRKKNVERLIWPKKKPTSYFNMYISISSVGERVGDEVVYVCRLWRRQTKI